MPCVLSRPARALDVPLKFTSGYGGLQDRPYTCPDAPHNYHCWLEHKETGKIWDPTPTSGYDGDGDYMVPLTLNGKVVPYYKKFTKAQQLDRFKQSKSCLPHDASIAHGGNIKAYLASYDRKPKFRRCFQNTYAKWALHPEIRKAYHFRMGSFGYETDDPDIMKMVHHQAGNDYLTSVLSLDFGF
jgi:hypothetical protein